MVHPAWWIAGLAIGAFGLTKADDAAESGAKLAKWATIGGGLYVSYAALKSTGVLK